MEDNLEREIQQTDDYKSEIFAVLVKIEIRSCANFLSLQVLTKADVGILSPRDPVDLVFQEWIPVHLDYRQDIDSGSQQPALRE